MYLLFNTLPSYTTTEKKNFSNFFFSLEVAKHISALGMFSNLGQDLRIARGTTFALNSFKK